MSTIGPLLGLAMLAGALAFGVLHAWRLYQRGVTDRVWIFDDANTAALFLAVIVVTHVVVRVTITGPTQESMVWTVVGFALLPTPYVFYASGRALGNWQRARVGGLRSPAN